jgi:hypothetical protein
MASVSRTSPKKRKRNHFAALQDVFVEVSAADKPAETLFPLYGVDDFSALPEFLQTLLKTRLNSDFIPAIRPNWVNAEEQGSPLYFS